MAVPAPETGLEMILTAPGRSRQRLRDSEQFNGLVRDNFFTGIGNPSWICRAKAGASSHSKLAVRRIAKGGFTSEKVLTKVPALAPMNKKDLTEADIRTKFITPAILGPSGSKWNVMTQVLEERYFTKGRIIVRGKTVQRGEAKKADYILFYKPNIPIAVVEAKDNNHSVGAGMQQALDYAETLDVPFAYSSNGDGFVEHDRTGKAASPERDLALEDFPTADELWSRYRGFKGYTPQQEIVTTQDYYSDPSGKTPHYFQQVAINRTVDAISRGENRVLLVMATGTGKTYTAFQIIWRLWKAGVKKRILFLVDRNILADQTKINDFKPFGQAMTKITKRTIDKSYEIYLSLYQAVTGTEEEQDIYKEFSPDFFDLVIIDECHRGSAAGDASWRRILDYFSPATQN
jgi:type I restriction enzyme, R subunit